MILKFEDYVESNFLNESLLTEELDFKNILKSIKSVKNKNKYIKKLIDKFNNTTNRIIRKNISIFLLLLYFGIPSTNNTTFDSVKTSVTKIATELSNKNEIDLSDVKSFSDYFSGFEEEKEDLVKYVDIRTVKTSEDGIELIKDHEKLVLTAYALGDGMVTIGYGHANPINKSPYKIGDKITEREAYRLFNRDLKRKEEGVRRMLLRWDDQGIDVKITQSMFDAMVSMAFNMGIGGLIRSEFVNYVKEGLYREAAELIKSTRLNPRFPGLKQRRADESELFLKDISLDYNIT